MTSGNFEQFDTIVREHLDQLLPIGERWLVTIIDTYLESGQRRGASTGAAAAISAMRMFEKFHSTVEGVRLGLS